MKTRIFVAMPFVMLLLSVAIQHVVAQGSVYSLSWFSLAGGATSSGGSYSLKTLYGEPVSSQMAGGVYTLIPGALAFQVEATPTVTPTEQPPTPTDTPAPPTPTDTPTTQPTPTDTPTTQPTPTDTPTTQPPAVGDGFEPDNGCDRAHTVATDGTSEVHTFSPKEDDDWIRFDIVKGATYIIVANVPITSSANVVFASYKSCAEAEEEEHDPAFAVDAQMNYKARRDGVAFLRIRNHQRSQGGSDYTYLLSVRRLPQEPSVGAAIIVAGKLDREDPLQTNIYTATNSIYALMASRGYGHDRIYYLSTDPSLDADGDKTADVDAASGYETLKYAITQWARQRVDATHPLILYMMDHGRPEEFYLDGAGHFVTPDDLHQWLGELEAQTPGLRSIIIIEACNSGSFLFTPQSISKPGRIVITSTGPVQQAYPSDWSAIFTEQMVTALYNGRTLFDAFLTARAAASKAHSDQTPFMDDNGNSLFDATDGQEAQHFGLGSAAFPGDVSWPPMIVAATAVRSSGSHGTLSATVVDDREIRSGLVRAVLYPPSYVPPPSGDQLRQENLPSVTLADPDHDGVYTGEWDGFTEAGVYRVVFYARDDDARAAQPYAVESGAWVYLPAITR
jgi:hypothetical protein